MNATSDSFATNDEDLFDVLVDGELTEQQRRSLLAGLDDVPGGWRRCAMAFLEAQCWREEFGSLARRATPPAAAPRRPGRVGSKMRLGNLLAMAACFLIALGLGLMLHDTWFPAGADAPGLSAVATGGREQPAAEPYGPQGGRRPAASASPWKMVTIPGPEGPIRFPAIEREQIDEQWLRGSPTAFPGEILQALKRAGREVRQSRQLFPIPMDDGRRLVVPVDELEVRYVGNRVYQ